MISADPPGFEDTVNLSHVPGAIGPIVVRFNGRDKIKRIIGERQARDAGPLDFNPAGFDSAPIETACGCYGRFRVVHAMHFAEVRHLGKPLDSPSSATTNVQNGIMLADVDVF